MHQPEKVGTFSPLIDTGTTLAVTVVASSARRNMGLNIHRNHQGLLGTGKCVCVYVWVGRGRLGMFISSTHLLHCHHQNDCIKVGSCVSHFNVS